MNDEPTTEATRELPPPPPPPPDHNPRRLTRSRDDRVLAGVSGGLGSYFGVDPVIFRIGFALSIFFGGLGVFAYLLLAVFVPAEGDERGVGDRLRGGGFWRAAGLVVLALMAVGGLLALAGGAGFAVALGWAVPTALVVIAIGVLLALAAFRGGARWLIPPAVALAVGASVAAAADVDFSGGIGERSYRPLNEAAIPADGYRLGVGELTVDLRELDWKPRDVVELETSMGAGLTAIYVPEDVCVTAQTRIGAGDSVIAGERDEGFDLDETIESGAAATPRLELDAELDAGELWVVNSDSAPVTGERGPGWYDDDFDVADESLRTAQAQACAAE
jgi:phage shock protein PspC (stress-responsive transcriptional regulator)